MSDGEGTDLGPDPIPGRDFTRWAASDVADLRAIWTELAPDSTGPDDLSRLDPAGLTTETRPRFRGVALTPQEAGYVFQRWITEAFRLADDRLIVHHDYVVPMDDSGRAKEEIDGLVIDGWQAFLVQVKFGRAEKVAFEPIAKLHLQVEQRPAGTMGLLFAASGFTPAALSLARELRPVRVLLFSIADILSIVEGRDTILDRTRRRWLNAVQSGSPILRIERSR